ncbi:MAG: carbohydrate porin [Solirubrobacterales bacterium]
MGECEVGLAAATYVILGLSVLSAERLVIYESEHSEILQGTAHSTRAPHGLEQLFGTGVTWGTALTQVYQQNTHGGLSTDSGSGRYAGSYDIQASADMEKILGWRDSTAYMLLEGGWPRDGSIDPAAVGSCFGVNADAIGGEWIDVAELWFLRSFADDRLFVQVGKADLSAGIEYRDVVSAFDLNRYANDETSQFLNNAFANNPTIPFPAYTLALSAVAKPCDSWQFAAAGAAQSCDADIDETASWASDDEGLFFIAQVSFLPEALTDDPLWAGEYHVGAWWTGGGDLTSRDELTGAYLSAAREIFRESDDPNDEQGLGLFVRGGWADGDAVTLDGFWSVGLQYRGLIELRDEDVLGVAFARGTFAGSDSLAGLDGSEQAVELYYSVAISRTVFLSPDIQYVADPDGEAGSDDALIAGLRARILIE